VELEDVQAWIDAYVRAWQANDAGEIGALFGEDARYFTHPFREPWRGRETIVEKWTEHPDAPGSWDGEYRAIAVTGSTGVVRGSTRYFKDDGSIDHEYANVFIIAFDPEGRATEFTEFFMRPSPPPRS